MFIGSKACNYISIKYEFSKIENIIFERMYRDYISELGQFSDRIKAEPVSAQEFENIYNNQSLIKIFILNNSGVKIGFCLLGFGDNTHPETDYYIGEFYIAPEHRREGWGRSAIKELLSLLPGKYCYHILKGNKVARLFWDRVVKASKSVKLRLYDISNLSDCDFFAFDCSKLKQVVI